MMGKDCERISKGIYDISNAISSILLEVSSLNEPPIKVDGSHSHNEDGSSTKLVFLEKDTPVDMSGYISKIRDVYDSIKDDIEKMGKLGSELYTNISTFNNSIGSPWLEVKSFKTAIEQIIGYGGSDFVGNRSTMISLLNIALSRSIDAKWGILMYHDYLQRGFDAKYNEKLPSVRFKNANKKDSIGNIDQDFEENVNIPRPSLDPF